MRHHTGHWECERALEKLHHFIDDELEAAEVAAMIMHLDGCDSCSHEADVVGRLKAAVKQACSEVAPDHLKARVAEAIAELRLGTGQAA
ncbi:MAG: zf-HC2 domain-containing protein [Bifidobacteriaceae bacterium]|jgi:mycothiol system anti-sigma-R factor|nr:zf-HC2 domain-containing protein [Bifidobacteriaceae bacterium]